MSNPILVSVVKHLVADDQFGGRWPDGVDHFRQTGSSTITARDEDDDDVECFSWYSSHSDRLYTHSEIEDCSGLDYMSEWDTGDCVTKEEYEAFVNSAVGGDLSKLADYFANGERKALAEIALLNKEIGINVDKIVALAAPWGIEVQIDVGQRGSLDLNGPWDSSSAYC